MLTRWIQGHIRFSTPNAASAFLAQFTDARWIQDHSDLSCLREASPDSNTITVARLSGEREKIYWQGVPRPKIQKRRLKNEPPAEDGGREKKRQHIRFEEAEDDGTSLPLVANGTHIRFDDIR
jgi:hypothetical protein